jgi:enolase-phosphatase E1
VSRSDDIGTVRGVVLDIEGTTTPVSFVYDVLFPYARERLAEFLSSHANDTAVREALGLLQSEWLADGEAQAANAGRPERPIRHPERPIRHPERPIRHPERSEGSALPSLDLVSAQHYLEWLMDRDRKSTALKIIQGEIWRGGFESGVLRGDVYADVQPALERWRAAGRTIAIYSSGSTAAQRLLFGHSTRGDLTPLIDAYFDTTIGHKRSTDSYSAIARALELPSNALLFISDVEAELVAARGADLQTRLCVRGETAPPTTSRIIRSFEEL